MIIESVGVTEDIRSMTIGNLKDLVEEAFDYEVSLSSVKLSGMSRLMISGFKTSDTSIAFHYCPFENTTLTSGEIIYHKFIFLSEGKDTFKELPLEIQMFSVYLYSLIAKKYACAIRRLNKDRTSLEKLNFQDVNIEPTAQNLRHDLMMMDSWEQFEKERLDE